MKQIKRQDVKTPRDYVRSRRCMPFGLYKSYNDGQPEYKKVTGGMVAVVDGKQDVVKPGLLFCVEMMDGVPVICSYWPADKYGGVSYKAYTLRTLQGDMYKGRLTLNKILSGYNEMIEMIHAAYPNTSPHLPTMAEWWREYGFFYDDDTGAMHNPLGLE